MMNPHLGMRTQMGLGGAKALAGTAYGIGSLATYMSPSLGNMVESLRKSYPGISKRMDDIADFANSENKTLAESSGYWATVAGLSRFAPGMGWKGAASRIVGAINPPRFVRGPWGSYWASAAPTATTRTIQAVGTGADAATKGAIGGAVANPDDPKTGAIGGAILGPLPGAASAAMRSPAGRYYGSHALPWMTAVAAEHMATSLGIPGRMAATVFPLLVWYRSPASGPLHRAGSSIFDYGGRLVATIPPAAMGYFSAPAGEMAKGAGDVLDATVGDYARDVGAKTLDNIERRR